MADNDARFDFAKNLIREAGALALEYFERFEALEVQSKGVQDMASEADYATEKLIAKAVAESFPDDAFLGEESASSFTPDQDKGTWIVDPIDGTQPFVNGIASWCIAIAYVEDGVVQLGLVYDPVRDELFSALRGAGATLNGRPINVADVSSLEVGLVSIGYSNRVMPDDTLEPLRRLLLANGMYHRSGSGALSLAYVAAGRLIGYFEPHMNSWDFVAGCLLVEEAGGTAFDSLPDSDAMVNGNRVLAGAAGVYADLERVIFDQ